MVSDKMFTDAGVGRLLFTFATIVLPANSSINLNCNFHVISTLKLKNDLPVVPSLTEEIHMVFSIKENFLVLRSIGNFAWIFAQTQIRNQVNEATKGRHIVKVRNNASLKVITLFQHYKLKDAYLFYLPVLLTHIPPHGQLKTLHSSIQDVLSRQMRCWDKFFLLDVTDPRDVTFSVRSVLIYWVLDHSDLPINGLYQVICKLSSKWWLFCYQGQTSRLINRNEYGEEIFFWFSIAIKLQALQEVRFMNLDESLCYNSIHFWS